MRNAKDDLIDWSFNLTLSEFGAMIETSSISKHTSSTNDPTDDAGHHWRPSAAAASELTQSSNSVCRLAGEPALITADHHCWSDKSGCRLWAQAMLMDVASSSLPRVASWRLCCGSLATLFLFLLEQSRQLPCYCGLMAKHWNSHF